ncbi:tRNA (adenosine(37)-N6)-threonylcarbamoyltransferase complex transferase subunit TsaD [candidate division KSB1 bacterium]|nr:tRNA (adenosine(37)-N6)-threonylcarbamoyltransferase complex transferase subunit TsaD [candidate division KSB1 bacterium]
MLVLGIETSCDETSAAVYGETGLLSNKIASQLVHQQFGGVVPELASRAHIQQILPIVTAALAEAHTTLNALDGIAVTYGPGLVGSILVGLNFGKALALALNKPLIGINHIEGHIFANFVLETGPAPPFITLIVSGGHTLLVLVEKFGVYRILGSTKDDAAGEAFDKVAKMLNLGYPGGPIIDKVAQEGDPDFLKFSRPKFKDQGFDFSFSGIKTAVLYFINTLTPAELEQHRFDIAASFRKAVVKILVDRSFELLQKLNLQILSVVGGVASNRLLRQVLAERARVAGVQLFIPPPVLCTDNAAMIARAGYFHLNREETASLALSPNPNLKLI